jgi:hypothetical protein
MKTFEELDARAKAIIEGGDMSGHLSTSERIYVALAANRVDLLERGDTIAYAMHRLGPEWREQLMERWRRGVPDCRTAADLAPREARPPCGQAFDASEGLAGVTDWRHSPRT